MKLTISSIDHSRHRTLVIVYSSHIGVILMNGVEPDSRREKDTKD